MTMKPLTPIRTDNEVLLLKAAKDVLNEWDSDPESGDPSFMSVGRAIHRLRRAVEICEGEEDR